jgi:hypothetical protein
VRLGDASLPLMGLTIVKCFGNPNFFNVYVDLLTRPVPGDTTELTPAWCCGPA